jgi:hypothetical protein
MNSSTKLSVYCEYIKIVMGARHKVIASAKAAWVS